MSSHKPTQPEDMSLEDLSNLSPEEKALALHNSAVAKPSPELVAKHSYGDAIRESAATQPKADAPAEVRERYEVIWHNDNACDTLGIYDTLQAAEDAGNDWYWTMVAVDSNPKKAQEVYSFEVQEIEDESDEQEQHSIEGTHANFNRYIAGDR